MKLIFMLILCPAVLLNSFIISNTLFVNTFGSSMKVIMLSMKFFNDIFFLFKFLRVFCCLGSIAMMNINEENQFPCVTLNLMSRYSFGRGWGHGLGSGYHCLCLLHVLETRYQILPGTSSLITTALDPTDGLDLG